MELYAVTDGVHRHEFSRGTPAAAFAQARGVLVMDPRINVSSAELQIWRGDCWRRVGPVTDLPQQALYSDGLHSDALRRNTKVRAGV